MSKVIKEVYKQLRTEGLARLERLEVQDNAYQEDLSKEETFNLENMMKG